MGDDDHWNDYNLVLEFSSGWQSTHPPPPHVSQGGLVDFLYIVLSGSAIGHPSDVPLLLTGGFKWMRPVRLSQWTIF